MDHEGKGETTEEGGSYPYNRRRVKFKCKADNINHINKHIDKKPNSQCLINNESVSEKKQQSPEYTKRYGEKLDDSIVTESSNELVGILRPRSISLSPLPLPSFPPVTPRFSLSKLSKAINRSIATRGCIEKLKKRFFYRPEHEQLESQPPFVESLCSHSKQNIENGETDPSFWTRQKRRTVSLENTKVMMGQRLPPTMMPFTEEALKAAYFFRRRRKENGHGRIIHKILIEHHKQVLKELARNELRDGEQNRSSRQQL